MLLITNNDFKYDYDIFSSPITIIFISITHNIHWQREKLFFGYRNSYRKCISIAHDKYQWKKFIFVFEMFKYDCFEYETIFYSLHHYEWLKWKFFLLIIITSNRNK